MKILKFLIAFLLIMIYPSINLKADHQLGGELRYHMIDSANGIFEICLILDRFCNTSLHPSSYPIDVYHYNGSKYIHNVYVVNLSNQIYIDLPCGSSSSACNSSNSNKIERNIYKTNIIISPTNKECLISFKGSNRTLSTNLVNPDQPIIFYLSFIPKYKNSQAVYEEVKRHVFIQNELGQIQYQSNDLENDSLNISTSNSCYDLSVNFNSNPLTYNFYPIVYHFGLNQAKPFWMNENQVLIQKDKLSFTPNGVQSSWLSLIKKELRKVNVSGQDTWICISQSNIERIVDVHNMTSNLQLSSIISTKPNLHWQSNLITICSSEDSVDIRFKFAIDKKFTMSFSKISRDLSDISSQFSKNRTFGSTYDTLEFFAKILAKSSQSKLNFDLDLCDFSIGKGYNKQFTFNLIEFQSKIFASDTILSCGSQISIPILTNQAVTTNFGNVEPKAILISAPKDTWIIANLTKPNPYCPSIDSIYLNQGSIFSTTIFGHSPTCKNYSNGSARLTVNGSNIPFSFKWSNNAVLDSISSLSAKTYSVTITDKDGCQQEDTVKITDPLGIEGNFTIDTSITCRGGSNGRGHIEIALPLIPIVYYWNHNSSSDSFMGNLSKGTYTGRYAYHNLAGTFCDQNFSFEIPDPDTIKFDVYKNDNTCFGDSFGKLAIIPKGGNNGYRYFINTIEVPSSLKTNLKNGVYNIYINDSLNCISTTQNVTIQSPSKISFNTILTNPSCQETANGRIEIQNLNGGFGKIQNSINGSSYTYTSLYTLLDARNYKLYFKDENGCQLEWNETLANLYKLNATLDSMQHSLCPNTNSGKVYFMMNNGTMPYTIYDGASGMSFNSSQISLLNLSKGSHDFLIKDKNLCQFAKSISITEPDSFKVNATIDNINCYNGNDGKISLLINGGTPSYLISWQDSKGIILPLSTNLSPDTYYLKIIDKNKCQYTQSYILPNKPIYKVEIEEVKKVSCYGYFDGKLTSKITGGELPYTYVWNSNNLWTRDSLLNINAGNYQVEITDRLGCKVSNQININQPNRMIIEDIIVKNTECPLVNTGSIGVNVSGGSVGDNYFEYSLNNSTNFTTKNSYSNLNSGLYTIKIRDRNLCIVNIDTQISTNKSLSISIPSNHSIQLGQSIQYNPIINFGANTSSSDILSYQWTSSNGVSCQTCAKTDISPVTNSTYYLEVKYGNKCMASATTQIDVSKPEDIYIPNTFSPNGDNQNDIWLVYGKNIKNIDIQVMRPNGEIVFQSKDINKGWDGFYQNKLESIKGFSYVVKAVYLDGSTKLYGGILDLVR